MELFLCPLQYHRYPEEELLPVISRWKVSSRWKSNMALKPIILNDSNNIVSNNTDHYTPNETNQVY